MGAYASASKAAPSPPGTTTIQVVKATVTLPGVTAAAFDINTAAGKKVRLAFQTSVASKLKICGKDGKTQCTSDDVVITSKLRFDDMCVEPTLHVCVMRAGTHSAHNISLYHAACGTNIFGNTNESAHRQPAAQQDREMRRLNWVPCMQWYHTDGALQG